LEAISVRKSKGHAVSENSDASSIHIPPSGSFSFESFTDKDLEFISEYNNEHGPDVFRQILHSFCPSIYGHELVKGIMFSPNMVQNVLYFEPEAVFSCNNMIKHNFFWLFNVVRYLHFSSL
jgi:hypothetical protein